MDAASDDEAVAPLKTNRDQKPYRYEPLDHSKTQVRLLRFRQPTNDDTHEPSCDIYIFDLDCAPEYHALSYTWGSPLPVHTISVNNGYLSIRDNLFRFCKELCRGGYSIGQPRAHNSKRPVKHGNGTVHFWIDQLCIDQANTLERNRQVNVMSQIFSRAESTIIWLHDEGQLVLPLRFQELMSDPVSPFARDTLRNFTRQIINHTYFSRLWIIQEIVLAKEVQILLEGGVWLPWYNLQGHVVFVPGLPGIVSQLDENRGESRAILIGALSFARRKRGDYLVQDASSSVLPFCRNDCSDPRDKVYGLLGLVAEDFRIEVDYKKSVYEVLIDVLKMVSRLPRAIGTPHDSRTEILTILGAEFGLSHVQHNGWVNLFRTVLRYSDARRLGYGPPLDEPQFDVCYARLHMPIESLRLETTSSSEPSPFKRQGDTINC